MSISLDFFLHAKNTFFKFALFFQSSNTVQVTFSNRIFLELLEPKWIIQNSFHCMKCQKKILSYLLPAAFSLKAAARAKVNFQEKPKKLRSGKRTNGEAAAQRFFVTICVLYYDTSRLLVSLSFPPKKPRTFLALNGFLSVQAPMGSKEKAWEVAACSLGLDPSVCGTWKKLSLFSRLPAHYSSL